MSDLGSQQAKELSALLRDVAMRQNKQAILSRSGPDQGVQAFIQTLRSVADNLEAYAEGEQTFEEAVPAPFRDYFLDIADDDLSEVDLDEIMQKLAGGEA